MSTKRVIYVADPMCSWCWGFAPVIEAITKTLAGRADLEIVLGGLRSETGPVPPERRDMYRQLWPRIEQLSGQPFRCDLVYSPDFAYDTEPACRAVVTVRTLEGDLRALEMFARLQAAFYADSLDITRSEICAQIATDMGVGEQEFVARFAQNEFRQLTQQDFQRARELGATGFPTLIVATGSRGAILAQGYRPFADLREPLQRWLDDEAGGGGAT